MIRSEIIELANQLTERKAEKVLSLPLLFTMVLQDFCGRNRYWWRKQSLTFTTVAGTKTYDLSSVTTVPASTLAETAVEEVTVMSLIVSANPLQTVELNPVFDDGAIIEMTTSTTPAQPSRYTFDGYKTVRLDPPDGAYTIRMAYWAMPNPGTDTTSNTVPIIPPFHHKALVYGMVSEIWQSVYGPTNPKVTISKQRYEDAILLAQARPNFTSNRTQQLITSNESIRST